MGKLSVDMIPVAIKPPCKVAGYMLAVLDSDDFDLIAEQLAGGMSMAACYEWIKHTFPTPASSSALQNHLKGRCSCPESVPLRGIC